MFKRIAHILLLLLLLLLLLAFAPLLHKSRWMAIVNLGAYKLFPNQCKVRRFAATFCVIATVCVSVSAYVCACYYGIRHVYACTVYTMLANWMAIIHFVHVECTVRTQITFGCVHLHRNLGKACVFDSSQIVQYSRLKWQCCSPVPHLLIFIINLWQC